MHRRALRPICQCRYIDSSYPAAVPGRRRQCLEFHSSPRLSQSGEAAAAAAAEAKQVKDTESSSSEPSRPTFRGGWGSAPKFGSGGFAGQASVKKPFGLSAAEIASRNAILATNSQPAPSTEKPREAIPTELKKSTKLEPEFPPELRKKDWVCPDCAYSCFGKHTSCPKCRAARPGLQEAIRDFQNKEPAPRGGDRPFIVRPKNNESGQSQTNSIQSRTTRQQTDQDFTIRKLGVSAIESWRSQNNREAAFQINQTPVDNEANERRAEEHRIREERMRVESERQKKKYSWPTTFDAIKKGDEVEVDLETQRSKRKPVRREQFLYEDDEYDPEEREARREKRKHKKKAKEVVAAPSPLYLPEFISVSNLATVLGVRQADFIDHLEEIGFEGVVHSHVLDAETAGLIAAEYNFEPIFESDDRDLKAAAEPEDRSLLPPRPPVVTIMGHVDHGKTTLLDWLRKSSVAASEHGGITQHIGAFSVSMPSGKSITFLDTPGHAAFLDMRRRGADMTDIVVLVVAADDSVKPQTLEAINHAKQANVPIIVAINKIDKDNVNPEKVKQDLARHSVDVEDYGGDVQAIQVSGKTGQGMVELEEAIVTLSELLDHRADIEGNAEGWVVEATTKKAGRVATILVRRGTIHPGDILVAGSTWTRIKTLKNEAGMVLKKATPGMPVEIDGWKEQPEAGSEVLEASSEQHAKEVVEYRIERMETKKLSQDASAINESRRETVEQRRRDSEESEADGISETSPTGPKPINFIIKADVFGSVEAVTNSVSGIGNNEIFAQVLRSGVGQVTEFDIKHAATSKACVINFNNAVDPMISRMAESQGVKLMNHNIIYELIDDVKATMSEELPPTVISRVTGEAEIGQIFEITVKGRAKMSIAGCKVRNGVISRSKKVRVLRGKETIYDGSLSSLKNVKKDVTEMRKDTECGMCFEGWSAFEVGDHVQSYEEIFEKRYLQ